MIGPDDVEMRVLGCLIEKQKTTPDQYPLTLNSLRLACNQSTNRDPVVEYDEATVRAALGELGRRRWIRGASGHTSRTQKYRQLLDTELKLDADQIAVLAVLMLRGPQTPGELKQRADRLFSFHDLAAIHTTLDALISRDFVERLQRRPGQKEERYRQILGGEIDDADSATSEPSETPGWAGDGASRPEPPSRRGRDAPSSASSTPEPLPVPQDTPETERIEELERQVASLRQDLDALRQQLGD
ncbi:MAG: YceH family protein [Solirubrobacterales bacterium]